MKMHIRDCIEASVAGDEAQTALAACRAAGHRGATLGQAQAAGLDSALVEARRREAACDQIVEQQWQR